MIHTVVGILYNNNRVLTAWRTHNKHAGGVWEFPGGKVEHDETAENALQRELKEEIGIDAVIDYPLIALEYDYPERRVFLDAYEVTSVGQISACEGQFLRWYPIEKLVFDDFPAANCALINAIKLPNFYAITPNRTGEGLLSAVKTILSSNVDLLLLRAPIESNYSAIAKQVSVLTAQTNTRLMLHNYSEGVEELGAVGVHFSQAMLKQVTSRPLSQQYWFSVSCHSLSEVLEAEDKGADFCVLGPVAATPDHQCAPIGFDVFAKIAATANIPVFALGGMTVSQVSEVRRCGGQGIAGIRCFSSATEVQ